MVESSSMIFACFCIFFVLLGYLSFGRFLCFTINPKMARPEKIFLIFFWLPVTILAILLVLPGILTDKWMEE